MTYHSLTDMPPVKPADIPDAMAEKIQATMEAVDLPDTPDERPSLTRLTIPVDTELSALDWISARPGHPRIFWSDRDGYWEMAGFGVADQIRQDLSVSLPNLFEQVKRRFASAPETIRYYGGFRFDSVPSESDETWKNFPALWFVLPRFEFIRYGDTRALACNLIPEDLAPDHLDEIIKSLPILQPGSETERAPKATSPTRIDQPDEDQWNQNVDTAHNLFGSGDLKKIVLARRSELTFQSSLSAWELMNQLEKVSERCYMFAFEPDERISFIGSSPEKLYSRDGQRLATEALAGTRSRGTDVDDDERLAEGLINSVKERLEHRFVVDGIADALRSLNASIKIDRNVSVVKLPHVQHLYTQIFARLSDAPETLPIDEALLGAMHPTPAVAGLPTDTAMQKIRELEVFDRGWYAGPVGWIGPTSAEFAVAIRSGLVTENRLHLFAGAGIVPGSVAEHEWRELNKKLTRFIALFTNGT